MGAPFPRQPADGPINFRRKDRLPHCTLCPDLLAPVSNVLITSVWCESSDRQTHHPDRCRSRRTSFHPQRTQVRRLDTPKVLLSVFTLIKSCLAVLV